MSGRERPSKPGRLLSYLQLFRLPNVFTAVADVAMGFLYVQIGSVTGSLAALALVAAASMLLYSAGMVLNDYFDLEIDRRERPQRPLPSGRIDAVWAGRLGFSMLAAGVVFAGLSALLPHQAEASPWRAGAMAVALAASILLYDGALKKTAVGPVAMGSCRFFNVLMGMSAGGAVLGADHLLIAGGIGVYIIGVTLFARSEATTSNRMPLIFGTLVIVTGLVMLGYAPQTVVAERRFFLDPQFGWPMLLGLLGLTIVRRCTMAISNPAARQVQLGVKNAILSLIMLDAAVTLLAGHPGWAVGIVALLVPSMFLGRWVYST